MSQKRVTATVVLIVGILLTALAGWLVNYYYKQAREQQVVVQADSAIYAIRVALDRVGIAVQAVRALYASDWIGPEQFDRFTATLTAGETVRSLSFYRRVTAQERAAYEAELDSEPGNRLGIWERDPNGTPVHARDRPVHYVIEASHLLSQETPSIGLDLLSFPDRTAPIEEAVRRLSLVASEPLDFLDTGGRGVILYVPVRDRLNEVIGIAAGSISFIDLATIAKRASGVAGIDLQVVDLASRDDAPDGSAGNSIGRSEEAVEREFDFGHRRWTVHVTPMEHVSNLTFWAILLIAAAGAAATAAALAYLSNRAKDAEVGDARLTLRRMLDGLGPLAWLLERDGTIVNANKAAIFTFGRAKENGVGKPLWALPLGENDPVQIDRLRTAVAAAASNEDVRFDLQYDDGTTRNVFDLWIRPLTSSRGEPQHLVASAVDVTDRYESEETQRLLMRELDHRMKNTLQVIQAIIRRTARAHATVDRFEQSLLGRVNAMSRAHELLAQERWLGADATTVIRQEASTFDTGTAIEVEGPPVRLNPKAALSFALAIHELGTNASKYGALTTPAGRVSIEWSIDRSGKEPRFKMCWRETGGPSVRKPETRGFGSMLIERSIAYELDGEATVEYRPEGLVCTIYAPVRTIRPFVPERAETKERAVSA